MRGSRIAFHVMHGFPVLVIGLIVLLTGIAFYPVAWNEFVDWDDWYFIVNNHAYRGLSWDHLAWMFTSFWGSYQPLCWLSWAIESQLWGIDPMALHLTNLALHTLTAVVFFLVARRLIGFSSVTRPLKGTAPDSRNPPPVRASSSADAIGALTATLFFAVHPLRVETVAWATERLNLLSGLFLVVAVLFYLRAVRSESSTLSNAASPTGLAPEGTGNKTAFLFALVAYVLSLLSKGTGITLPVVLLLMDFYPLSRFRRENAIRALLEKVPFAVLAALGSMAAIWAKYKSGALRPLEDHSLGLRIAEAFYGLIFYPWKTLWPTGLIPLYEQRLDATPFEWRHVVSVIVVLGISIAVFSLRKRWPSLLWTWIAYIILLSPLLGLTQSGPQVVADRYSYIACLPFALLVGGAAQNLWGRIAARRQGRAIFLAASVAVFGCLVVLTNLQTRVWRDSIALWTTTIARAPETPTAYAALADVYNSRGEFQVAKKWGLQAVSKAPGNRLAQASLARSLLELGDFAGAEGHYETAQAVYNKVGKKDPAAMTNLALAKFELGKRADMRRIFQELLQLGAEGEQWSYKLATRLAMRGEFAEARDLLSQYLAVRPDDVEARVRLSIVFSSLGDVAATLQTLEEGLRTAPNNYRLLGRLARVLATSRDESVRNPAQALELARQAVSLSGGKDVSARESLAAALAAMGDFEQASATLHSVLAEPGLKLPDPVRYRINNSLKLFGEGKPIRE